MNKGPSDVSCCESFEKIESMVVSMLEKAGFKPGTEKWNTLYCRGFQRAISERAKFISSRLSEARTGRRLSESKSGS